MQPILRAAVVVCACLSFLPAATAAAAEPAQEKPVDGPSDEARQKAEEQRKATTKALDQRLAELTIEDVPVADALARFAKAAGVTVAPDWAALEKAGVKKAARITMRVRNVKAVKALVVLLDEAGKVTDRDPPKGKRPPRLTHFIEEKHGHVAVTSYVAYLESQTVERQYDVSDLLAGGMQSADLILLVCETVEPDSWEAVGGKPGKADATGKKLVITQTKQNHRTIERLLASTRGQPSDEVPEDVGGDGL